jgi:hypothetical protein
MQGSQKPYKVQPTVDKITLIEMTQKKKPK